MKNNKINKNAKSYLAKLLATENISVEHRKVKTAFFDLKQRLLVVPIWKEMNKDILDLLLAHEIGHALFTPQQEWKDAIDKEKINRSFLNVIEDARIEKLVKRKYPGLQQSFIKGYRDLINNDFFKTRDRNVDEMLLIDRLNMHFKTSFVESTIYFSSEEKKIIQKMLDLETFDDVKKLAKELMDYCDQEAETKGIDQHGMELDDEDGDTMPSEVDSEDSDNEEEGEGDNVGKEGEEENEKSEEEENADVSGKSDSKDDEEKKEDEKLDSEDKDPGPNAGTQSDTVTDGMQSEPNQIQSETDEAWSSSQDQLLDPESKDNAYMHIHEFKNLNEFVIGYKQVLEDFRVQKQVKFKNSTYAINNYNKLIEDYKKFQKDQNKAVSYMVKEFELKKAAAAYSRAKQDKSGVIDPLKLHSYKYNDDIFKRLTLLPDGKNHGLMMYIDWSGSMSDKLTATIHQLMNLTMFCRKVGIPFEVYAFSNNTSYKTDMSRWEIRKQDLDDNDLFPKPKYQEGDISIDRHLVLFNLISSKMSAKEYDQAMTNMYHLSVIYERYIYRGRRYYNNNDSYDQWKYDLHDAPRGYDLSSTPLNDTIMAAMKMVPAFQKSYNIDKMNTVFLTDGSSDGNDRVISFDLSNVEDYNIDRTKKQGYTYNYMSYDYNHVLVDRVTKRQVKVDRGYRRGDLTEELLTALKLRTGTKVLGFFISGTKRLDRYALDKYFPEYKMSDDKDTKVFNRRKVMQDFRKNKCLVVKDNTGYDELYLLAGDNLKVEDGQMATPSENAKKGEIKRLFSATLKSNKGSRVILNKFISQVA